MNKIESPIDASGFDAVAVLLAASSRQESRGLQLVYLAEAELVLEREAGRLAELRLLLDARKAEVARLAALPPEAK